MAEVQGSLEFADTDAFMEHHFWSLLDHPAKLNEHEFSVRQLSGVSRLILTVNRCGIISSESRSNSP